MDENREQRVESSKDAPKVEVLLALLRLFTVEQLMFLVNHCETAVQVTGFARVEIVFENGHVAFLYPAAGLRFPKPNPTPAPPQMGTFGEGKTR